MKSGGGVLCIALLQIVVGLCLLGIYEGYKTHFLADEIAMEQAEGEDEVISYVERNMMFETPMDFLFYLSCVSNVFSVFGLAGVLNQQRDLVTAFFIYNAVQMVVSFHYFVDVCADIGIRFKGQSATLDSYEQSAAAFMFFNFFLSVCATAFAVRAVEEIQVKQREEYNRLSVLSDTLQFEPDTRQ